MSVKRRIGEVHDNVRYAIKLISSSIGYYWLISSSSTVILFLHLVTFTSDCFISVKLNELSEIYKRAQCQQMLNLSQIKMTCFQWRSDTSCVSKIHNIFGM